ITGFHRQAEIAKDLKLAEALGHAPQLDDRSIVLAGWIAHGVLALEQGLKAIPKVVNALHQYGKEEVEHEDGDEARDEGLCTGPPHPFGPGAAVEAFVATDQPDGSTEDESLEEPGIEVVKVKSIGGKVPIGTAADVINTDGDERPAPGTHQIAIGRQ